MSIQKNIVVRYQAEGHVRFQVPAELVHPRVYKTVVDQISHLDGVYRVFLFRGDKKLSVRYHETVCDLPQLAKALFQLLADLEKQGVFDPQTEQAKKPSLKGKAAKKISNLPLSKWFNRQYTDAKETLHAAKIVTKVGLKKPKALIKDPEKAIIDFLNDVLVLYLIKLHWTRITQEWIIRPISYRYEWMAVFYLFYLLVRSRKPKK